jgi:hypothetical protein
MEWIGPLGPTNRTTSYMHTQAASSKSWSPAITQKQKHVKRESGFACVAELGELIAFINFKRVVRILLGGSGEWIPPECNAGSGGRQPPIKGVSGRKTTTMRRGVWGAAAPQVKTGGLGEAAAPPRGPYIKFEITPKYSHAYFRGPGGSDMVNGFEANRASGIAGPPVSHEPVLCDTGGLPAALSGVSQLRASPGSAIPGLRPRFRKIPFLSGPRMGLYPMWLYRPPGVVWASPEWILGRSGALRAPN